MMEPELDESSTSPQREALTFHFDRGKVDPEMVPVMDSMKELAEKMLYRWKTFPIILPPSLTASGEIKDANGEIVPQKTKAEIKFQDLFIAPTFNEMEEVAKDSTGGLKKLNEKQLMCLSESGEFDVESIHFPGHVHKWRLTQLLQKGSKKSQETLLNDTALALRILIITARNRFCSHYFSLSQSVKSLWKGFWELLDIAIGMPSTTPGDIAGKIHEEHMKYLVAELVIRQNSRTEFNKFCEYLKEKCKDLRAGKQRESHLKPPPIPYSYQTPKGVHIDLRLFNKDLINNCLPILSTILDKESKGWHIQFRKKLIQDYKSQGFSVEQISEKVTQDVMEEYLKKIFNSILNNAELENLQPGIGNVLVSQAKAVLAMQQAVQNIQIKMQIHKEKLEADLKTKYPVKSRIKAWMNEQLQSFEEEFIEQNLWSAHEDAIHICEEQNLNQMVYFLRRDLNFIKERETVLKNELGKVKIPTRIFTFNTRLWLPKNWIITRFHNNEATIIPTVIETNRSTIPVKYGSKRATTYAVDKYITRKTSTRYPLWRWWNYLQRTWSWMWNAMFMFGVIIPWCSPVSFRALFYFEPFKPDLELSQIEGKLYPRDSSRTHTLISRLRSLWNHVFQSRHDFEDAPDTGFLGKSFARHFNRFWNYFLKGAIGSLSLCIVFPPMCILSSVLSVVVAIATPIWMPLFALLAHISAFLFYDFDCPDEGNKLFILFVAIFWRILVQGCIQPVCAVLFSTICCPFAALVVIVFGILRRGCRAIWDTFMFHSVIKSRARVPARDGFIAKRIAGPGLASNYFFQIKPEQALAALEAKMELDELEVWQKKILKEIEQPKENFSKFSRKLFTPFSARLSNDGEYESLCQQTSTYLNDVHHKVAAREKRLSTGLYPDTQRKVKLLDKDLRLTINLGAKMLESFYPEHVISKSTIREKDYWENLQLEFRDWRGFACKKFSEIFSKNFLVPLEETDNNFQLKVEHLNLGRYVSMLKTAEFRDDLDVVTEMHSPTGDINMKAPQLDAGYFNPSQKVIPSLGFTQASDVYRPWKSNWKHPEFEKLEIPLPIPHPANIAVSIYNRDNDQDPINTADMYCQKIIKATKDVPYVDVGDENYTVDITEMELSTPDDYNTFDSVSSHLARQESGFSHDNPQVSPSRSTPVSGKMLGLASEREEKTVYEEEPRRRAQGLAPEREEKIVYEEEPRDTKCVVCIEDTDL